MNYKIDNLQYCNWSREIFEINREAELDAVHVTIVYHEDYDELLKRVDEWNIHFKDNSDLIFHGKSYKDIEKAKEQKNSKTKEEDIVEEEEEKPKGLMARRDQ